MTDQDAKVRLAAFEFLADQQRVRGDVLPRDVLVRGFDVEGVRVPLIGPQGIFKPAILRDAPLSITTVPLVEGRPRPYDDGITEEGIVRYRYRGTDPNHRDNRGLRLAMGRRSPLIYFYGIVRSEYLPIWPVFVVGDDPRALAFLIAVDQAVAKLALDGPAADSPAVLAKSYVVREVRQRVHQRTFQRLVLRAYRERCAVCSLRHRELLDAAHIIPDRDPLGSPEVPNGLAMCKLHHAAFDADILGIRPDLRIELRLDVLHEEDGPMLVHGLQEFQNHSIEVPQRRLLKPRTDYLEERYTRFKRAG